MYMYNCACMYVYVCKVKNFFVASAAIYLLNKKKERKKKKDGPHYSYLKLEHGVTKYANLIGPLRKSSSLRITPFST